jgi:RecB family exonuclease
VLRLPEERDEVSGPTPLERGTLLHELFERFYATWQRQGEGTITAASMPAALALFADLTRERLAALAPADRALEEVRLLGSLVSRGVADRAFSHEAAAGGRIVERRLEQPMTGAFTFPRLNGLAQRTVEIRGKADRIDVFDDGALRVVDYKLGRPPDAQSSVQVAVYAHCAQQQLLAADAQPHPIVSATYLAFADDAPMSAPKDRATTGHDVERRASAFAEAVEKIEAGAFPPRPRRFDVCTWCAYARVCRKEYRMEGQADADAAEPV